MSSRHDFAFDRRFVGLLRLVGVTPTRSYVQIRDGYLEARFGPWFVRTPVSNVSAAKVTGPHRPLKAIGPRFSPTTRSLTFGTNAKRTTQISFRDPVQGMEPTGVLRHPTLTVSVENPDLLARELEAAASQA